MKIYLLKFFHFRKHESLPYRVDGRGGNVFHGVGSHVVYSDLRHRWYSFAFEVATENQSADVHAERSRLAITVDGQTQYPQDTEIAWQQTRRNVSQDPRLSSYQWVQHVEIDLQQPAIMTVGIEFQFSDRDTWLPVEGVGRLLVDLHPGSPPPYYSRPIWYLRRLLGKST